MPTPEEINVFARKKMGAEWPIMAKADVNGKLCHEVYKYLRVNSELFDSEKNKAKEIPWNFTKFLIDKDGKVLGYFPPTINPAGLEPKFYKYLK